MLEQDEDRELDAVLLSVRKLTAEVEYRARCELRARSWRLQPDTLALQKLIAFCPGTLAFVAGVAAARDSHGRVVYASIAAILMAFTLWLGLERRSVLRHAFAALVQAVIVTFIVLPVMIWGGFLLGPRGVEGLIAAPLILLVLYSIIGYRVMTKLRAASRERSHKVSDLTQCARQTERWLESLRMQLPYGAIMQLDRMGAQVDDFIAQERATSLPRATADRLCRIVSDEVPALVREFLSANHSSPYAMKSKPHTAQRLVGRLDELNHQIGRLNDRAPKLPEAGHAP